MAARSAEGLRGSEREGEAESSGERTGCGAGGQSGRRQLLRRAIASRILLTVVRERLFVNAGRVQRHVASRHVDVGVPPRARVAAVGDAEDEEAGQNVHREVDLRASAREHDRARVGDEQALVVHAHGAEPQQTQQLGEPQEPQEAQHQRQPLHVAALGAAHRRRRQRGRQDCVPRQRRDNVGGEAAAQVRGEERPRVCLHRVVRELLTRVAAAARGKCGRDRAQHSRARGDEHVEEEEGVNEAVEGREAGRVMEREAHS